MPTDSTTLRVQLPQLNRRFRQPAEFQLGDYQLLPFTFMRLNRDDGSDNAQMVLTNLAGHHITMPASDVTALISRSTPLAIELLERLYSGLFIARPGAPAAIELLAQGVRSKLSTFVSGTSLHIFVATLRCDHSCPYCQVSRVSDDRTAYDLSTSDAEAALQLMFSSPSPNMKLEVQGGEPLLNFPVVRFLIEQASVRARDESRDLQCVVTTNLANITEEMCLFFREYSVRVSTSIDGPEDLHNANRPRPGNDAFQRAIAGIGLVRNICGTDSIAALPTTTRKSLGRVREIVDTYLGLGFTGIFLRPLSPFGFAVKTQRAIGYETADFIKHYLEGVQYCLELCKRGYDFREYYASLLLRRMLTPLDTGYVDLMNPSGIGNTVLVYNYDGDVYASDEARMLAETGEKRFRLGSVRDSDRQSLLGSHEYANWLLTSMNEGIPGCDYCAYRPWCGTDPVFHVATQRDLVGVRSLSAFCSRNMAVFDWLVQKLAEGGEDARILRFWGTSR